MTGGDRSAQLMRRATAILPGGVNSPVRAFGAVGGTPPFIASGSGPYLTTWTAASTWTWSARGDR